MPCKVLLVEDERALALGTRRSLEAEGHEVILAATGPSGVEAARTHLPDVVFMDLRLPGMNGFDAAFAIRNHPQTCRIPIVALTAHHGPEDYLRGLLSGFNQYLVKPVSKGRLLATLEEQAERAAARARRDALFERSRWTSLLRLERDQTQILRALLRELAAAIGCDGLVILRRHKGKARMLAVLRAGAVDPGFTSFLAEHFGMEETPDPVECQVIFAPEDREASLPKHFSSCLIRPLVAADCACGEFLVGRFGDAPFTEAHAKTVDALLPLISRLCARDAEDGCALSTSELPPVQQPLVALVWPEAADAARWVQRLGRAVPSLELVEVIPDPSTLRPLPDWSAVLVHPDLRMELDRHLYALGQRGMSAPPVVELDPVLLGSSERRLTALVFLGMLFAFSDARRTGVLHVIDTAGKGQGLVVFREGQVVWAQARDAPVSLANLLVEHGLDWDALRCSLRQHGVGRTDLAQVIGGEGRMSPEAYRSALRRYLVIVMAELRRLERPRLLLSQQVSAQSGAPGFAVEDLTVEVWNE